ncbi:MAG: hypothetical protein IPL79_20340 [Myxococcales bacterium]|nr:hypothetical protein [Myxococcales bacterium]
MMIQRVPGFNRVLGKAQGYLGLPVRDYVRHDPAFGGDVNVMETAWQPTPDQLAALNAGANIHVHLFGSQHPPIMIDVGPVPDKS